MVLAESLKARGAEVVFVCRPAAGDLCAEIERRGFGVCRLPVTDTTHEDARDATAEAVVDWTRDAEETRRALAGLDRATDWLIVDHYSLDARWERRVSEAAGRVMVIDDLADREHDCDALLDQNLVAASAERYVGKVPARCAMMIGPRYALLQRTYRERRPQCSVREGAVRRVCVSFGGGDVSIITSRTLAALMRLDRPDIAIDVVVPRAQAPALAALAAGRPNVHVHSDVPTLAPFFGQADLALGAAGTTTWERLCMGLPSLVVTLAANQLPIAEELRRRDLARWLGDANAIDESAILRAIAEVLERGLDRAWSERCFAAVDGLGAERVASALSGIAGEPLHARHVCADDESLLLRWANDPQTRAASFRSDVIDASAHREWLHKRLSQGERCRFYVIESAEGVAVGQVRFEATADCWEISYSLAPEFRRRGLGQKVLQLALTRLSEEAPPGHVQGRVKPANIASRSIFEASGFTLTIDQPDLVVYKCSFELSAPTLAARASTCEPEVREESCR